MKQKVPSKLPTLEFESKFLKKLRANGNGPVAFQVAGVDEVGRGCLAGPVVACAVVLPLDQSGKLETQPEFVSLIKDSKMLSPKKRETVADQLKSWVRAYGIGSCSPDEIDEINILQASLKAMERAILNLAPPLKVQGYLIDGNQKPKAFYSQSETVIKGDQRSLSIAAASILAKVYRDQWMSDLAIRYQGYGFEQHKGYLTQVHLKALKEFGATELHRKSFSPIKEMLQSK